MTRHVVPAIANAFLDLREGAAPVPQTLLHKLVYLADGMRLAETGAPLVDEAPEAWDNGPVYRSLWNLVRDHGFGPGGRLIDPASGAPFVASLTPEEAATLAEVWRRYAPLGALRLSLAMHRPDSPWSKAYFERGREAPLDREETRRFFASLNDRAAA